MEPYFFWLHISETIYEVTNHPVHIRDKDGEYSPSAFIPFCEFQGNMSVMGVKIDQFDVPVCNSFQEKILNDQLCYEVDLQNIKQENYDKDLKLGLAFLMDYNEDRNLSFYENIADSSLGSFGSKVDGSNENNHAFIYLNTIGNNYIMGLWSPLNRVITYYRVNKINWWRKIQFEWNQRDKSYWILSGIGRRQ